jgi:hypothetical protein
MIFFHLYLYVKWPSAKVISYIICEIYKLFWFYHIQYIKKYVKNIDIKD